MGRRKKVDGSEGALSMKSHKANPEVFDGNEDEQLETLASEETELLETEGTDKLRYLLNRVGNKLAVQYSRQIKGVAMGDRVHELSVLLDRRGIRVDFELGDDVIILHEYNCPYHDLASVHRDVCEMERSAFSQALGADVTLGNCIQDGHHSCQFVVSSIPGRHSTRVAAN